VTRLKIARILGAVVILYVILPFVAGLFAIGDRDGPKIYPEHYHAQMYMITYEAVRHEKPRQNFLYDRPLFYGFPRKRRVDNGVWPK